MPERIDLLARHHQRLVDVMDAAYPLITASINNADLVGLRHLRREMGEAIAAYVRFVDEEVAERSSLLSDNALADARLLLRECRGLQSDYDYFASCWNQAETANNWTKYRLSARCMMQHVRNHLIKVATMRKRWTEGMVSELPLATTSNIALTPSGTSLHA